MKDEKVAWGRIVDHPVLFIWHFLLNKAQQANDASMKHMKHM